VLAYSCVRLTVLCPSPLPTPPPPPRVPVIHHDFSLEVLLSEDPASVPPSAVQGTALESPVDMGVHQLSLRAIGRVKLHHLRVRGWGWCCAVCMCVGGVGVAPSA
jgi:hypothetical protein